MANEDDKAEYLNCFAAFIVESIMITYVCLLLKVQPIILH